MMRKITLEGKEIGYELERKNVRNINVRIKPGGEVYVSAGNSVPETYIDDFMRQKSEEILKAVDKYSKMKPRTAAERLGSGSTVYLLGEPLTIRVEAAASNMVTREGSTLIVYSAGSSTDDIIDAWYDVQCRKILPGIGHMMYERFSSYVDREPEYRYRKMKSRWGSCNPVKLRMSINRDLVMYERSLIEFVYCHEYSHFIHPDHSPSFYRFMSSMMPDHEMRKFRLKKMAAEIGRSEETA